MLTYETLPILHPTQSGSSYVDYTVSHYFQKTPDKIKLYKQEANVWRSVGRYDIGDGGTEKVGYNPITITGTEEISVRVYKIDEQDVSIKFVCLDLS